MTPRDVQTLNRFPKAAETYAHGTSYFESANGANLRAATGRLYDAFEDCALSIPITACSHRFTKADVDYVQTTPLRLFTLGDMSLIGTKFVTTLGEPIDIAYFVPRLIEAIAEDAHLELGVIARLFERISPAQWTAARRKALRECFELLFAAAAGTERDFGLEDARKTLRALPLVFDS